MRSSKSARPTSQSFPGIREQVTSVKRGKSSVIRLTNTPNFRHPRESGDPGGREVCPVDTLDSRLRGNDGGGLGVRDSGVPR